MNKMIRIYLCLLSTLLATTLSAQDTRTQYSSFLSNSYFSVNLGYIHYPFSSAQLEPGYTVESIETPPIALRVVLLGHQFNKYLSAQVSYMRPVKYAAFKSINNDKQDHFVWMHYGSLTLKSQIPLSPKLSVAGEAGLGIVTRKGFRINDQWVVKSGSYETVFLGAGLEYHLSNKWDLLLSANLTPSNDELRQPQTTYYSAGFRLNMRPLSPEKVAGNASGGYIWPKHLLQFGYTTNALGYGVNNFLSKRIPIFWGGGIELRKGYTLRYQRNIFHTKKVFAFNVGVSASYWQSARDRDDFYSLALSPIFQFNVIRSKPLDLYLFYSVAGPSYLSQVDIDGEHSGKHFTFQDYMGFGIFTGKKRNLNFEVNINHYSNGNIFTENAGLKIPSTFTIGYAF